MRGYQWCSRLGPEDLTMGTLTDAPYEEILTVVQNRQHTSTDVDDVPMHRPDPSPPPDRSANTPNGPQSFELEGERRPWASSNETSPDDNAHVSGASGRVKDTNGLPKKLQNGSERVQKCLEQRIRSRRARDEPDKLRPC